MISLKCMIPSLLLILATRAPSSLAAEPVVPPPKEPPRPAAPAKLPAAPAPVVGDDQVLVSALQGVVFLSQAKELVESATATGIKTGAVPLLDNARFRSRLSPFLGKPVSLRLLKEIERLTIVYFREQDRPLVDVSLPEQDIANGVVQLLVQEGKLGQVRVEGNRWFDGRRIWEAIRAKPGESVQTHSLLEDLDYLNRNPFRTVEPVFAPGAAPGTTDLILKVEDRIPVRVFTGYENSGTDSLGRNRLLAGINWGNVFGRDHELGYQFMADVEFDRYLSHSAYWRIPLPWRHTLAFFGSYADVDGRVNSDFNAKGKSWQISTRYIVPLTQLGNYRHEVQAGFDFKQNDNDLLFGGSSIRQSSADAAQFVLRYGGGATDRLGSSAFGVEGVWSPGYLTGDQDAAHYQAQRPGASPRYVYTTATLERDWGLPGGFSLINRITGQAADGNLLPSEQFGLGGYSTVRGYDERWSNGDLGLLLAAELRTPFWNLGRCAGQPRFENRLQLLTFIEYGSVSQRFAQPGEVAHSELSSAGLGLRYKIGSYLDARFDYGWRLSTVGTAQSGDGRPHISMVASF